MLAQLGPYLIDEELAQGGMARVFRARLRGLGGFEKTLVIKQILPELARDPRFVELFVREANTLVSLSHPHIVPVYELGAVEGTYYLSMEYVEGATVARMLEQGPLAPALVAHLGAQISEALAYAHGRFGILHRDITPRNIIVDQAGHARLVDFGIAGSADVADKVAFGSPGYMPPEQVERRRLTPQSDLFALGTVLFEALCAQPAFENHLKGTLAPTPELPSDLEPGWHELLNALLAKEPGARPASAAEVARALRTLLARTNPQGALEDMQRRVRDAARAPSVVSPSRAEETPPSATTRLEASEAGHEARAIATSPVLTEMLRSSALAARPTPAQSAHAESGPVTRPIRGSSERAPPRELRADARLTRWMLRAWPLLSALALVLALFGRSLFLGDRDTSAPARPTPTPPGQVRETPTVATPSEPSSESARPRAEPSAAVSASGEAPAALATGQSSLSVNATPWAEVKLDGRAVGVTPLRKLRLRAGSHVLALACPPLGRNTTLKLEVKPGQAVRVVVDLSRDPPRTFLDGVREAR